MRVVVQRVSEAAVVIAGEEVARIARGMFVLAGIEVGDTAADPDWLAGKLAALRIFPDELGRMNKNVGEIEGRILVVSQFTLHAATAKGNRPGFTRAARPEEAVPLYEKFLTALQQETGHRPERGVFAADMQVSLVNDGPVTILIDSRAKE